MTEGLEAVMEEFDIREAAPEDAEKIIAAPSMVFAMMTAAISIATVFPF